MSATATDTAIPASTHTGLILLAHGSKDPNWRLPFEAIAQTLQSRYQRDVSLAFLESMQPDCLEAVASLVQRGKRRIVLAPLFLGAGAHTRKDVQRLLQQVQAQYPSVVFDTTPVLGELPEMQDAIASLLDACLSKFSHLSHL